MATKDTKDLTTDQQPEQGTQPAQQDQTPQQGNTQDEQFRIMQAQIAALQEQLARSSQPVQTLDPKMIRQMPGYLPPQDAAGAMTRLQAKARQDELKNAKMDLPSTAKPVALHESHFVPMPAGGIATLAELTWPDDFGNQELMDMHIKDLLILNRDIIRDDTSHSAGALVRVPV
jgi:hypothetical protein